MNSTCGNMLCKKHYKLTRKEIANRICKVCQCNNSSGTNWVLGYFIPDNSRCIDDCVDIGLIDWVCEKCNLMVTNKKFTTKQVIHENVVSYAEEKLKSLGACIIGELVDKFRELMDAGDEHETERECILFRKH